MVKKLAAALAIAVSLLTHTVPIPEGVGSDILVGVLNGATAEARINLMIQMWRQSIRQYSREFSMG